MSVETVVAFPRQRLFARLRCNGSDYNPETRQWYTSWANSRDGQLGPPMTSGFRDGIGEFYNRQMFNGQAVFVRFIFSENSFGLEQACSADGGRSCEPNWIGRFEP